MAGGYELTSADRFAPTLNLHDPRTGAVIKAWRGDDVSRRDAILLDGAQIDDRHAVFVVGEPALQAASVGGPAQPHLLTVDDTLQPAPLVDIDLPPGLSVSEATLRMRGGDLLVTYTDRSAPRADRPPTTEDDYDTPLCYNEPTTWVELRNPRTGALKASAQLKGYVVSAADGGLLGGSRKTGCEAESRGVVFALDAQLRPRPLYADETLGRSEVSALKALPSGRTLVVANKQSVLDYRDTGGGQGVHAMTDLQHSYSGLVLILARDGKVSPPTMVDTGRSVFLSAAETDGPGRLVVGGSVGGGAALVRLGRGRALGRLPCDRGLYIADDAVLRELQPTRPPTSAAKARSIIRDPKPRRSGALTGGPPESAQRKVTTACSGSLRQVTETRPASVESEPYLVALVASSCRTSASPTRDLRRQHDLGSVERDPISPSVGADLIADDVAQAGRSPVLIGQQIVCARQGRQAVLEASPPRAVHRWDCGTSAAPAPGRRPACFSPGD